MLKKPFLEAVEFASKAIGRSSAPILETIHLKSESGIASATGSNADLFCRHSFECDAAMDICVAARRLKTVLASLPAERIELKIDDSSLTLTGGGARAVIQTMPPRDFPAWIDATGEYFPIPGAAIKQVVPAVSVDINRPILMGVLLDVTNVVATDGRRLHFVPDQDCGKTPAVIPSSEARLIADLDGKMCCDDRRFTAIGENWAVTGKLIEGKYPNWKVTIPDRNTIKVEVPEDFQEAVLRAVKCSTSGSATSVDFKDGEIVTEGYVESTDFNTGHNFWTTPERILDIFRVCETKPQCFAHQDFGPLLFKCGKFTAVLMPQIRS